MENWQKFYPFFMDPEKEIGWKVSSILLEAETL